MITVQDSDRDFYRQNGYWISPKLFTDEALQDFRAHFDEVLHGRYETNIPPYSRNLQPSELSSGVTKIANVMWSDSTLSRLILSEAIGAIAADLTQYDCLRYWRDHMWHKPPIIGQSGNVGWHQDYYYWQCAEPSNFVTVWIALDDVTRESGCLEYIPGSHEWGLLKTGDLYEQDLEKLQTRLQHETGRTFEPTFCEMAAGTAAFHNGYILHGSRNNQSNRPRLSISIHMFEEGIRFRDGRAIKKFSNIKLLSGKDGDLFLGPHFPVIYRRGQQSNPWSSPYP